MTPPRKRYALAGGLDPASDDEMGLQDPPSISTIHPPAANPTRRVPAGRKSRKRARFAGFAGGLDPDSDDEMDLEKTVTSHGSGRTTVTYRAFPAEKKSLREGVTNIPPRAPSDFVDEIPSSEEPKKRNQSASAMMQVFSDHFDELQSAILSTEHHEQLGKDCRCGANQPSNRCLECFQAHLLCQSCILATHIHIPFHHIQQWDGNHFERTSLFALGATVALGHRGQPCPNRLPSPGRTTVIVHVNGIHHARIQYCGCANAPAEPFQLARSQLFPATITQPATAFTFDVLRDFHVHSATSKESAVDYFSALRNHTNKAFPQKTPDRYRELVRVARVWQQLTTVQN